MTKWLAIFLAVCILVFVIDLVRREKLTFKYAFGWICLSLAAVFFAIFDSVIFKMAYFFGFALASNFIFFILLAVFVFMSLLMTIFLCQQNSRNDLMAQKIGLLECEIKQFKESKE